MAAIYEAVKWLDIVYCSPPASFEKEGQRIRTCETIFSQKLHFQRILNSHIAESGIS